MSYRYVVAVLVVALLGLGGWTLAQQDRPAAKETAPASGQFIVTPAGDTAVLLDTKSGNTWVLQRSGQGDPVWLLARRIDSVNEVRRWTDEQEQRKARLKAAAERQKGEK
jgi:hypothetical protein